MPKRHRSTAAWRISIWTAAAFAIGSAIAFSIVYLLVAKSVRQRGDAWLIGEADTLAQVAENTPRDSLYERIVEEVAELATQEIPEEPSDQREEREFCFLPRDRPQNARESVMGRPQRQRGVSSGNSDGEPNLRRTAIDSYSGMEAALSGGGPRP